MLQWPSSCEYAGHWSKQATFEQDCWQWSRCGRQVKSTQRSGSALGAAIAEKASVRREHHADGQLHCMRRVR